MTSYLYTCICIYILILYTYTCTCTFQLPSPDRRSSDRNSTESITKGLLQAGSGECADRQVALAPGNRFRTHSSGFRFSIRILFRVVLFSSQHRYLEGHEDVRNTADSRISILKKAVTTNNRRMPCLLKCG